jgi:hypothetical protein
LVSGFFLSRSYFDLFYHFVAIAIILKQLAQAQEKRAVRGKLLEKSAAAALNFQPVPQVSVASER